MGLTSLHLLVPVKPGHLQADVLAIHASMVFFQSWSVTCLQLSSLNTQCAVCPVRYTEAFNTKTTEFWKPVLRKLWERPFGETGERSRQGYRSSVCNKWRSETVVLPIGHRWTDTSRGTNFPLLHTHRMYSHLTGLWLLPLSV